MFRIGLRIDPRSELGEGALWDVTEQTLYWIDSHGAMIHRADARGEDRMSWKVQEPIGSMCLRTGGGAVVALRNGLHYFDFDRVATTPIGDPESATRRTRMNGGKLDRQERFVVGGMNYAESDALAGLYRLDTDGRISRLRIELYCGRLVRFAPDGTIDRLVGMPVDSITGVSFGGADVGILYVTSMARPYQGQRRREHEAGGVFAVHGLGVRGLPESRFRG